jgi:hypothetical protein
MPIVLKSGSLNLLEHSGPAKACNGIALHFTIEDNSDSLMQGVMFSTYNLKVKFVAKLKTLSLCRQCRMIE